MSQVEDEGVNVWFGCGRCTLSMKGECWHQSDCYLVEIYPITLTCCDAVIFMKLVSFYLHVIFCLIQMLLFIFDIVTMLLFI